jgi:hypothetical protein
METASGLNVGIPPDESVRAPATISVLPHATHFILQSPFQKIRIVAATSGRQHALAVFVGLICKN